jgi:putative hydrolase of the HAD superfamily
MAIRGVILDMGHTLMVLDGTWPEMFERGARDLAAFVDRAGLGIDGQAFAQTWLDRRRDGFARASQTLREVLAVDTMRSTFAQFGVYQPDPTLVEGAVDAFFDYEDARWLTISGAQDLLGELAGRGYRLGLYSNATHDPFIQGLVDRLGFRRWLDPVLTSAGTGIRKPDPAAFAPILAAWRLPPRSVAMVGDTLEADILGARRAGLRSVWIPVRADANQEGPAAEPEPIRPDTTLQRLDELPDCLVRLDLS